MGKTLEANERVEQAKGGAAQAPFDSLQLMKEGRGNSYASDSKTLPMQIDGIAKNIPDSVKQQIAKENANIKLGQGGGGKSGDESLENKIPKDLQDQMGSWKAPKLGSGKAEKELDNMPKSGSDKQLNPVSPDAPTTGKGGIDKDPVNKGGSSSDKAKADGVEKADGIVGRSGKHSTDGGLKDSCPPVDGVDAKNDQKIKDGMKGGGMKDSHPAGTSENQASEHSDNHAQKDGTGKTGPREYSKDAHGNHANSHQESASKSAGEAHATDSNEASSKKYQKTIEQMQKFLESKGSSASRSKDD